MTTPRSILLTVATGSLGSHILAALLDRTGATVYCLVRADGAAEARDRLGRRLESLGEPGLPGGPRLIAVAADLERPAFGLDSERYDALAESVDAIIHCAANVDLSGDYERLVPANVDATKSVIALSRRRATLAGRPAEIHHVSTMAVPDLFEALRRAGHRLDPVPSQEWWRRAEERRDDPLLQPLLGMRAIAAFVVSDGSASQVPLVRSDATWSALSDLGLRPGPFGAEFLDRLVAQLPLPAPRRVPAGAGRRRFASTLWRILCSSITKTTFPTRPAARPPPNKPDTACSGPPRNGMTR